jgi:hypothetical protein
MSELCDADYESDTEAKIRAVLVKHGVKPTTDLVDDLYEVAGEPADAASSAATTDAGYASR